MIRELLLHIPKILVGLLHRIMTGKLGYLISFVPHGSENHDKKPASC